MKRVPIDISRPTYKVKKGLGLLRDAYDKRYQRKGMSEQYSNANLVPLQGATNQSETLKGELYITLGDRRKQLPNSTPISYLGSDCSPDDQKDRELGNYINPWQRTWTQELTIRRKPLINGKVNQVSYNIEEWLEHICQFLPSLKYVLEGYGAHQYYGVPNALNIFIERPLPFDATRTYSSIKHWAMCGFWSPTDIDNTTGLGIWRACVDTANHISGGVEFEVEDYGNDEYIVARFRNFCHQRVVVGIRVIA